MPRRSKPSKSISTGSSPPFSVDDLGRAASSGSSLGPFGRLPCAVEPRVGFRNLPRPGHGVAVRPWRGHLTTGCRSGLVRGETVSSWPRRHVIERRPCRRRSDSPDRRRTTQSMLPSSSTSDHLEAHLVYPRHARAPAEPGSRPSHSPEERVPGRGASIGAASSRRRQPHLRQRLRRRQSSRRPRLLRLFLFPGLLVGLDQGRNDSRLRRSAAGRRSAARLGVRRTSEYRRPRTCGPVKSRSCWRRSRGTRRLAARTPGS